MLKKLFLLGFGLFLACRLGAEPMNFVVILTDEMIPDYVGAYGEDPYPTPAIDKLAADGLRFDNAFCTASMCTPARYSMQTGLYPGRAFPAEGENAEEPYGVSWNTKIDADTPTLARKLSAKGYNTGLAGKWHLTPRDRRGDFKVNFPEGATVEDPRVQELMAARQKAIQEMVKETAGYTHAAGIFQSNAEGEPFVHNHNTPWITKGAVDLLETFAEDDKPFFLMTTPMAVHGPWHAEVLELDLRYTPGGFVDNIYDYAPDYDWIARQIEGKTSGEKHKHVGMADMDFHVGLIRSTLKRLGLEENTAVIFLSDHGIEPGKASVYDRGNRIPMLIYWPERTEPGSRTDSLAMSIDVVKAIAAEAGLGEEDLDRMDGVDLRPVLENPESTVRDHVYLEAGYSRAVFDGRWKYIAVRFPESLIGQMKAGEVEWLTHMGPGAGAHAAFAQLAYPNYFDPNQLYDLQDDPWELNNLWDQPETAEKQQQLKQALFAITETFARPYPEEAREIFDSEVYETITTRTRAENNPHETQDWVERDHDSIPWPPKPVEEPEEKPEQKDKGEV